MSDEAKSGHWFFDAAVLAAVVSAVAMVMVGRWEPAVRFGILAVIMLGTRWGNVPPIFAAAFSGFLLLSTWASVAHWYRGIEPVDDIIHFFTPGSLAAAAYFLLAHLRVMPDADQSASSLRTWTPVLWVTLVGMGAATLWEFYEWVVEQISPKGMFVGYTDTVLDLMAGTLGSLTAGVLVLWWVKRLPGRAPAPR